MSEIPVRTERRAEVAGLPPGATAALMGIKGRRFDPGKIAVSKAISAVLPPSAVAAVVACHVTGSFGQVTDRTLTMNAQGIEAMGRADYIGQAMVLSFYGSVVVATMARPPIQEADNETGERRSPERLTLVLPTDDPMVDEFLLPLAAELMPDTEMPVC